MVVLKLLLGTLPHSIQLYALMQFDIQNKLKMESLDCSYIVFDVILRRGKVKRCVIATRWLVCPPDVVWEMLIDLLMKRPVSSEPQRVCDIGRDTCLSDQMTNLICNRPTHQTTHMRMCMPAHMCENLLLKCMLIHLIKPGCFIFFNESQFDVQTLNSSVKMFSGHSQINTYSSRTVRRLPKLIAPLCSQPWPPWLAWWFGEQLGECHLL